MKIPKGLPRGATVPEQLAGGLALSKCRARPDDGISNIIVTDCEAVMKVFGSVSLMCHHKSIFAGMWWDLDWNRALFQKVRSHQPEEKVGKPGEISKEDWEGNNMADEWAGQGVPAVKCVKKARGVRAVFAKAGEEAKEFATILENGTGPSGTSFLKQGKGKRGLKVAQILAKGYLCVLSTTDTADQLLCIDIG